MSDTVTIDNVGPIEHIAIPVPEDGGVVIFRGANGSGKSIALEAIDAAVSGKGKVPVRDGQLKGEVQAHGVTLKIGRSSRRKGEVEVSSLEGRLSISDLVDPGIKAPEAADAHRIRALVTLAAAKPDVSLFGNLLAHGEALEIITPQAVDSEDLVTMAARVKRDIEVVARGQEGTAEHYKREADAFAKAAEGSDPAWAKSEAEVDAVIEKEIEGRATLRAQADAAKAAKEAASEAAERLKEAEASYTGPTLQAALERREAATVTLRDAQAAVTAAINELKVAVPIADAAQSLEDMVMGWRRSIEAGAKIEPVDDKDLADADAAVVNAREEAGLAAEGRSAVESLDKRAKALAGQQTAEVRAQFLRDGAAGTDEILSEVIVNSGVPLRVEPINQQMRLVLDTDRGVTPFAELSPGERWRIALDIAAKALGEGGELTIPQHAWEALDPENRAAIAKQLKDLKIIAYTAEADDGPLRAERWKE